LSPGAYFALGFHAWRAGRLDEAEAAFRTCLDLNPEHPGAHHDLGRVHLARSNPEAALQEMEREKDLAWRRYGLALAYHALGRKKEADAALAEVLEKDRETFTRATQHSCRRCAFPCDKAPTRDVAGLPLA
jgi:tetratricopeptide (TPR) repeat protein